MTEPDGELGLFTQHDPQWQANHGGPRDPQPGNIGGSHRDTQGGPEDDRGTALPLAATPPGAAPRSSAAGDSTDMTVARCTSPPTRPTPARTPCSSAEQRRRHHRGAAGTTAAYLDVVINGVDKGQFAVSSGAGRSAGSSLRQRRERHDHHQRERGAIDAVLYGGDGNDTITGGAGNTFIDGGDRRRRAQPGGSRDVLVGGLGQDTLNAGNDDDILIGGVYLFGGDLDAVSP